METDSQSLLMQLGFNPLESEVYTTLLTAEPMTAYKIGKRLGKPTANVYKAIEALTRKGAVIIEEGKHRMCHPVPVRELMSTMQKNFIEKSNEAASALEHLQPASSEEKTYQLESVSLTFEKARAMLQRCSSVAIIDIFPEPFEKLRDDIESAIDRGVEVVLQVYAPTEMKGAHIVIPSLSQQALAAWKSQQLNLVCDGREHIIALFNKGLTDVFQATWSNNTYLSCMLHAGFRREHTLHQIMDCTNIAQVKDILSHEQWFYNSNVPGLREIQRRHVNPDNFLKTITQEENS